MSVLESEAIIVNFYWATSLSLIEETHTSRRAHTLKRFWHSFDSPDAHHFDEWLLRYILCALPSNVTLE